MTPTPIAYLLRLTAAGRSTIMCGRMFMSREAAEAAAARISNIWRTCEVVPVIEVKDA